MPSGAKKRKAAKKKKESQSKHSNTSLHGEEDAKHESDSEGGCSPTSQNHQSHHNQFTKGAAENGEKQLDRSIDVNKSNGVIHEDKEEEIVGRDEGAVVTELKVDGNGSLQRSSSSSSSSVERIVVDNSPAVQLVKANDSCDNSPAASTSDLDKAATVEHVVQVTESASDSDNVTSSAVELVVNEQGEEKSCAVDEKNTASDTVIAKCEEQLGIVVVDKTTVSKVLVETGLEKRDETASFEGSAVSIGTAVVHRDAKGSAMLENEDKVELPHDAPAIDAGVCADNVKDSPAREYQDHQLTAVLPSRPVQTTSWKGCCGLFELFAGSNR